MRGRIGILIEFKGEKKNISKWAREIGLTQASLSRRLQRMSVENALTIPPRAFARPKPKPNHPWLAAHGNIENSIKSGFIPR